MPSTGTPRSNTPAAGIGAPSASTDIGPPERMMPLGAKALDVRQRQVWPVDLAVDAQLAHPAGDELGVLAAEVEDEDLLVVDVHVRSFVSPGDRYSMR